MTNMEPKKINTRRARMVIVSRFVPPMLTGSAAVVGRLAETLSDFGISLFSRATRGVSEQESLEHSKVSPVLSMLRFPRLLAATINHLYQQKAERVMGVFPDGYHFFVSALASSIMGISYFPYLHNSFSENRTGWRGMLANAIVKLVFSVSRSVFLMSDGLLRYYETHYANDQFAALPHQYQPIVLSADTSFVKKGTIALIGAVNESNVESSLRVLRAFSALKNVEIRVFTSTPDEELRAYGITSHEQVKVVRERSYDKFMQAIARCELGVLTHGFSGGMSEIEYATIFPTRTLDLLASGRPILAHVPKNSFIHEFLTQYQCALVVEEPDVSAIVLAYQSLLKDEALQQRMLDAGELALKQFNPERIRSICLAQMDVENASETLAV